MLASSATQLPKGASWSYEVKWDGYRTLALKVESRVQLLSRNLKDATSLYPAITREVGRLRAESLLRDGEVVAVDEEGRPSFQALHHQAAHTLVFVAFDVLHLDGRDLTATPLDERRDVLAKVLKGARLLRSEPLPGTPEQIEKAVRELHLEGVVAKRRNSRYEPGKRSRSWVKVKFNRRQEFVVGGYNLSCKRLRRVFVCAVHKNETGDAARISIDIHPRNEAADGVADQHDGPLDTGSLEEQV
jgi:bifunctional non-homologous end joining protein LigD